MKLYFSWPKMALLIQKHLLNNYPHLIFFKMKSVQPFFWFCSIACIEISIKLSCKLSFTLAVQWMASNFMKQMKIQTLSAKFNYVKNNIKTRMFSWVTTRLAFKCATFLRKSASSWFTWKEWSMHQKPLFIQKCPLKEFHGIIRQKRC